MMSSEGNQGVGSGAQAACEVLKGWVGLRGKGERVGEKFTLSLTNSGSRAGHREGSKLPPGNLGGWTGFEVMSVWVETPGEAGQGH